MRSDGQMAPVEFRVPLTAAAAASIRHAGLDGGAVLRIAASLVGGVLRLEVVDDGHNGAVAIRAPSIAGGGFGLNVVEMLSRAWGVERDDATRVWVEMVARPTGV
jgi:hypothetical protein